MVRTTSKSPETHNCNIAQVLKTPLERLKVNVFKFHLDGCSQHYTSSCSSRSMLGDFFIYIDIEGCWGRIDGLGVG